MSELTGSSASFQPKTPTFNSDAQVFESRPRIQSVPSVDANPFAENSNPFAAFSANTGDFRPRQAPADVDYENYMIQREALVVPTDSDLPTLEQYDKQKYHVTNLCRDFIAGYCFDDECQRAHSREEMNSFSVTTNPFWKSRKCRAYHKDNLCMYGVACLYKHERAVGMRKNKHFYISNLAAVSQIFRDEQEIESGFGQCITGAQRLPMFKSIHAMHVDQKSVGSQDSQSEDSLFETKQQQSSEEDASTGSDLESN